MIVRILNLLEDLTWSYFRSINLKVIFSMRSDYISTKALRIALPIMY